MKPEIEVVINNKVTQDEDCASDLMEISANDAAMKTLEDLKRKKCSPPSRKGILRKELAGIFALAKRAQFADLLDGAASENAGPSKPDGVTVPEGIVFFGST